MRPTTAITDNLFDFDYLLHPGTRFEHPQEVVSHPGLSIGEKRAILSSWASDASAIASCPSLRAPVGLKAPVTIDEILEALCALDGGPRPPPECRIQKRATLPDRPPDSISGARLRIGLTRLNLGQTPLLLADRTADAIRMRFITRKKRTPSGHSSIAASLVAPAFETNISVNGTVGV